MKNTIFARAMLAVFMVLIAGVAAASGQAVSFAPTSLTFASQTVGTTSAIQPITVTNTGSATLNFTSFTFAGPNPNDFTLSTVGCTTGVVAGGTCSIKVKFVPQASGSRTATISVVDNVTGSPQSIPVSGTGIIGAPAVSYSPTSLIFASQAVGTTSAILPITVTNTGTATLNFTSFTFSGTNPGDFSLSTVGCTTGVAAGGTCSIKVKFAPLATGNRSAVVSVVDNVTGSPQSIPVSGTGTASAVGLSPTSLVFAKQIVGTSSPMQVITVTNTGTAMLNFTSVLITGTNPADFGPITHTCAAGLAPGASCIINVMFTPTTTGARAATVFLSDDAPNSPQLVPVSGTGVTLVSIAVTPASAAIALGQKQQFTATGTLSDSTTQDYTSTAAWTSSNTGVATVSAGLTTSVAAGASTISAVMSGVTGSASLTVNPPALVSLALVPLNPSVVKGLTQQFTATGTYTNGTTQNVTSTVSWSSSNTAVATISNGGLASTAGIGTTTITASAPGVNGTVTTSTTMTVTTAQLTSIAVTPTNASVAAGLTQQFAATGTYTDGSTQILTNSAIWSSSSPTIATINSAGLSTSLAPGVTTISAALSGITGSASLIVNSAALTSLTIAPVVPNVTKGGTQQFTATGFYTNGTSQNLTSSVTWTSSNTAVATIASGGLAAAVGAGTATITASNLSATGTITASTTMTVTGPLLTSLAVTPANGSVAAGLTLQMTATGTYSDGSTQNLTSTATWSLTDNTLASISSGGLVTGLEVGADTVTAVVAGSNGNITNSTSLAISPALLTSITLAPLNSSVAAGQTQQITALGNFTDGVPRYITTSAIWTSSTPSVATISSTGLASSLSVGTTTLTATQGGINASTNLTVTGATLVSLAITPTAPTVANGQTQQFTATGTYSDGTTKNLSSSVTWTSSSLTTATISVSGLASSLAQGTTTITASCPSGGGTINTTTTLTVGPAALSSIAVTPANPSIALGATQTFTANGTYTDGTTQNLTATAIWSSTNTGIATIATSGVATGAGIGSTTINAVSGSITGSTLLTVTVGGNVAVTLLPHHAELTVAQTVTVTPTITGTTNTSVNWSVDGIAGGNATTGTISTAGLYTPPALLSTHTVTATSQADPSKSASIPVYVTDLAGVFVYKNDQGRTGQNLHEVALTSTTVKSATFGKLASCAVDAGVYGQPLYYPNLTIPGLGVHNVVFVGTQNDTMYAFDADSSSCQVLWKTSLLIANEIPFPSQDAATCTEVVGNMGILGTPVIDPVSNSIYMIAASKNISIPTAPVYHHRLYSLDVTTGAIKLGGTDIGGTVAGKGEGSVGGMITFNPLMQKTRTALTLLNGAIYAGFGSFCDKHPYHGWLFAFDQLTLNQTAISVVTPDVEGGGVWMGGSGMAVDAANNLYVATGDGHFDANTGGLDYADSYLRVQQFNGGFNVLDYFTPTDQSQIDTASEDVGASGLVVLPDQTGQYPHLMLSMGKNMKLYLVNRDMLGGFDPVMDHTIQTITLTSRNFGTPSYWNGNVYVGPRADILRQYSITVNTSGVPSLTQVHQSTVKYPYPGTSVSIAAASPTATSGVAFLLDNHNFSLPGPTILHALDASNVATEFYNTTQATNNRDMADNALKFNIPTVANGKVYLGTQTALDIYGLLP